MSDLIEELGGYEASKNILLRKRYDHVAYSVDSNSFYDHEAAEHGGIDVRDLDDELLEYRRQHNIFEVGDKVSHTIFSSIFTINDVQSYSVLATTNTGYHTSLNIVLIRHCTDKEIAQGYRDE